MGVFKQSDVVKLMLRKWYKNGCRMFLKFCDTKILRIDIKKRVFGKVLLTLHFSMAFFFMNHLNVLIAICTEPDWWSALIAVQASPSIVLFVNVLITVLRRRHNHVGKWARIWFLEIVFRSVCVVFCIIYYYYFFPRPCEQAINW